MIIEEMSFRKKEAFNQLSIQQIRERIMDLLSLLSMYLSFVIEFGKDKKKVASVIIILIAAILFIIYSIDKEDCIRIKKWLGIKSPDRLYEAYLNEENGHFYKAIDESLSWGDAAKACENMGGYLATVTSEEEQEYISTICGSKSFYWLGGHNNNSSREFEWITGEAWTYDDAWLEGQPDDYNGWNGHEGFQFYLSYEPLNDGWDDKEYSGDPAGANSVSEGGAGYICEWE